MIHIVFQQADIDTIQKAIEIDAKLAGDIIQIKDDFAVGPIVDIYETEGYQSGHSRRWFWYAIFTAD